ncbi:lipocalin-like domain-containing protein [Ectothiorhodospira lacustris]|uniref:lipocalin-like domain-containing protein n=1 Tax=Ectothiorhodospira lacustris TaxID=2899127 RepID=UPI001EE78BD3|nr:lipocalin-like domain-containing protein [Ectothiorhodospira lacustris]MCG5500250.1 carotenoid 1,2-hydratase [Ectothiorhodospira lacustris]
MWIRKICPAVLALALAWLTACAPESGPLDDEPLDAMVLLGGDIDEGYARAVTPRPFVFPDDHGPHPEFRNEWWYITGNLDDEAGRRFGYQITFFRLSLVPTVPESASAWATNQVWMAHLAVTDVAGIGHRAFERFSRGAMGLAGAQVNPFRVWLDDWVLASDEGNDFPWRLTATSGDIELELRLMPQKPHVLQGDRGLSQKSAAPGNASHYYSFTRLQTEGSIRVQGREHAVSGLSWLDREWSTSALEEGQVGWDWFSLQLADGHDVMYYRFRREDGSEDPFSKGLWVTPEGDHSLITFEQARLEVLERWTGSTGHRYPVAWRLHLPAQGRVLEIRAVRPDQVMDLSVRYWEGAVDVLEAGEAAGRGYVEMTGY